jgi:hypothetical protein
VSGYDALIAQARELMPAADVVYVCAEVAIPSEDRVAVRAIVGVPRELWDDERGMRDGGWGVVGRMIGDAIAAKMLELGRAA